MSVKVLYIEDQPMNAAVVRCLLEEGLGCQVFLAANVFEGIRVLETEFNIGLIITDLHLPGSSGLVLLEKIKSNPSWNEIPIIVCTGDTNKQTVINVAKLGVQNFLCKPVTRDALRAKFWTAVKKSPVELTHRTKVLLQLDIDLERYQAIIQDAKTALEGVLCQHFEDTDQDTRNEIRELIWPWFTNLDAEEQAVPVSN